MNVFLRIVRQDQKQKTSDVIWGSNGFINSFQCEGGDPANAPSPQENVPAHTPLSTWSQPSFSARFYPPQLPVQRLDHSCKTPTGLVQIQVAGPQSLAHGLLARETEVGRVSVKVCGSQDARGSGGLLQAALPQPQARRETPRSGPAAPRRHRQRALEHGQRDRTFATSSGHANTWQQDGETLQLQHDAFHVKAPGLTGGEACNTTSVQRTSVLGEKLVVGRWHCADLKRV